MDCELIDDFADVTAWMPVASGLARLDIAAESGECGAALRLDYDFHGGGGFVVARRPLEMVLPETYVLRFGLRGVGLPNRFEVKLSDESGLNVWWYKRDAFELPVERRTMRIRSSEIEFAWGPAGGGTPRRLGAIEIAVVAGPGGAGTVWIDDLCIEDLTYRATPRITASAHDDGHPAEGLLAATPHPPWRSAPGASEAWLAIDFGGERELGGLVVHWERDRAARALEVETADDGTTWSRRYDAPASGGTRSYAYLPATRTRHLRLRMRAAAGGIGIAALEVKPYDFSRSLESFFHHIAAEARRGDYPRYLVREQTYWTPVGRGDGTATALLNDDGMLEIAPRACSVEPFLFADGRLLTWADGAPEQELADAALPIPSVIWRLGDLTLRITACAAPTSGATLVRYRVENGAAQAVAVRLFAVLRPFQVPPPWQSHQGLGGISRIERLRGDARAVWVDGRQALVVPSPAADDFGAVAFGEGSIAEVLRGGTVPPRRSVRDDFGCAAGALRFDATVPAGAGHDFYLTVAAGAAPQALEDLARSPPSRAVAAAALDAATAAWRQRLAGIDLRIEAATREVDTLRSAAAHILLCRDGAALQPGPRRYARSWIRDGAIMAAALLRVGQTAPASDFVRWYARFQRADGGIPCCVDRDGVDPLVEHDSHGQFLFAVMECFRFTGDRQWLGDLWPHVRRTVAHIAALRARRMGAEWTSGDRRGCHGLLPESASHEGYLAHPVHAYWDDLWALRGLRDAAAIATALGHGEAARQATELRDGLHASLRASIDSTMAARHLDYVPASVEWADFDPTAMAIAASLLDELDVLPAPALQRTFATYLDGFRRRVRGEIEAASYTPYEVRNAAALVRLGRREAAAEVLGHLLDDRRPPAWNQWPEIAWRDRRAPGHLGDLPHAWIAAEYILALRSMLVFEREADRALVIGAGLPAAWLAGDGVRARGLPTYFGAIDVHVRSVAPHAIRVSLAGRLADPAVTVVLQPPLPGPLTAVEVDGRRVATDQPDQFRLAAGPAEVLMMSGEGAG